MFCKCGCGQTTAIAVKTRRAEGRIKGEYNDFVLGHHNRRPRPNRRLGLDRWVELDLGYVTPCHIWTGPLSRSGSGRVRDPTTRKTRDAYVATWEAEHGPVPKGKELDHLCRVRACVRTDHLEPVTHRENMRRSPITKMTPDLANEVRAASGRHSDIAARFGISRTLVGHIKDGARWAEAA